MKNQYLVALLITGILAGFIGALLKLNNNPLGEILLGACLLLEAAAVVGLVMKSKQQAA